MAFVFVKTRLAKVASYVAPNSERAIFDGDNTQQYSYSKFKANRTVSQAPLALTCPHRSVLGSPAMRTTITCKLHPGFETPPLPHAVRGLASRDLRSKATIIFSSHPLAVYLRYLSTSRPALLFMIVCSLCRTDYHKETSCHS